MRGYFFTIRASQTDTLYWRRMTIQQTAKKKSRRGIFSLAFEYFVIEVFLSSQWCIRCINNQILWVSATSEETLAHPDFKAEFSEKVLFCLNFKRRLLLISNVRNVHFFHQFIENHIICQHFFFSLGSAVQGSATFSWHKICD